MKLLITALISAAIFLAVPTQSTPVHNLGQKPVHMVKAEKPATAEKAAAIVIPAEKPEAQAVNVQPETASEPTPSPEPVAQPTPVPSSHEELMSLAGISQNDWPAVDYIVSHESGWCPFKHEGQWGVCPDSPNWSDGHAYGMCQALPGTKMSNAGDDWLTNPVTQLKWCNMYAVSAYGGWSGAYAHWLNFLWW